MGVRFNRNLGLRVDGNDDYTFNDPRTPTKRSYRKYVAGLLIMAFKSQASRTGAGKLLPGVEARVIKSDGTLAHYGEAGELVVRGPAHALGYLNDEKA
jgi:acyl-CoA synthetase (AMP-forming)/AMP-acid ligase II